MLNILVFSKGRAGAQRLAVLTVSQQQLSAALKFFHKINLMDIFFLTR